MHTRLPAPRFVACALLVAACRSSSAVPEPEPGAQSAIVQVLDDWHQAASVADGARYFGHMADDSVFLGTDASERWTRDAFRAYCEPHFARGTGWTYQPRERHVRVDGEFAWFDERLWNEKYGECRGTGVLRKDRGEWKIVHYNLAFPVPNELAGDVVKLIRAQ